MLQYPVQLPPLNLSSPKKDQDYHRPNDLLARKRLIISPPLPPDSPSPRSPYISARQLLPPSPPSSSSLASQAIDDVLAPGDLVGHGLYLQGEQIRLVSNGAPDASHREPAQELEVIKRLGAGSYAVVYLVREVLSRSPPSEDGHMSTIGLMDFDNKPATVYGREYAVKCLSKANLDDEALAVQMSEVRFCHITPLHGLSTCSFLGHHPSVTCAASQYRHSPPHPGDVRLSVVALGIRARRGSLLFSRAVEGPL
ncbi:hypothetical protein CVT26_007961 [Gymnopilus dilepis]|uniref:Protein kinase domain-containing protein n=1 Tax=Gymnopilus dilepis TaxID=231916 RepID=A0A409W7I5_9AGAR|nr:hypothetical protein CVT26_007961 [Gymnopilus dilepis]